MELLIFKTVVLLIIHLKKMYSNALQFDEGCYINEPTILQLAFVMDNTGTFLSGGVNSFFKQFAALAPTLMDEIDKEYPGTQFALTIHADWNWQAEPKYWNNPHSDPEACYARWTGFTTDKQLFKSRINYIERKISGDNENGLSALAFTAADTKLGWMRNMTVDGKKVRRVLVLVTDEDEGGPLGNPGPRHDFKGDGTDTCSKSKPPDYNILREVFQKYQMSIIGLYSISEYQENLDQVYADHFKAISSTIPYCGRRFGTGSRSKGFILTTSERDLKAPKGFWAGKKAVKSETDGFLNESWSLTEEGFKRRKAEIAEIAEISAKAGKYDYLIKFVKDCLRETQGCLFGDPEGINTLGF